MTYTMDITTWAPDCQANATGLGTISPTSAKGGPENVATSSCTKPTDTDTLLRRHACFLIQFGIDKVKEYLTA